ncbi:(2Fe-2S) ferredoxin domain-containing protein [Paenibacillus sp. p3-SID867]|uniref:(2Fe-2S) ferredoxin domain-containing protein n=1 Tax=Paenibacillus sp. p3-SID867 TaxID=2916363 RepID=UPI0021A3475B|nr:(2Fe-2S) ferredoxin domain-containing protein [Paenibacillus sp. p3-SID867]MCT1399917.1 (2Fe-2S) ferredoxin domain-containing protein [Paenibacillus sp. p3-SID867]
MNNKIMVCAGKMCVKLNGEEAIEAVAVTIRNEIDQLGIQQQIEVGLGKCMRSCRKGCVVTTQPDMNKYFRVTPDSGREIVNTVAQLQMY